MATAVNSIIVHSYKSRSRLSLHIAWCHLAPGNLQAQCWRIQAMFLWVRFSVGIVKPSVYCLIIPINFNTMSQLYLSRSRHCLLTALSKHCSNTLIKVKTVSAYGLVPFSPRASAGTVLINLGHISSNVIFCEHFTAISRHYSNTPIKVRTVSAYSLVPFSPRASAGTVLINLGHISSTVIFCEHFTAISRHYSNTPIKVRTVSAYSLVPFSPRASAGTVLINLGNISLNVIFCEHFTAISRHYSNTLIKVKNVSAYCLVTSGLRASAGIEFMNLGHISFNVISCEYYNPLVNSHR